MGGGEEGSLIMFRCNGLINDKHASMATKPCVLLVARSNALSSTSPLPFFHCDLKIYSFVHSNRFHANPATCIQ